MHGYVYCVLSSGEGVCTTCYSAIDVLLFLDALLVEGSVTACATTCSLESESFCPVLLRVVRGVIEWCVLANNVTTACCSERLAVVLVWPRTLTLRE